MGLISEYILVARVEVLFLANTYGNGWDVYSWQQDYRKTWFNFRSSQLFRGSTPWQKQTKPRDASLGLSAEDGWINRTRRKLKLYILIMACWLQTGPTRQSAFNDSALISVNSIIRVMKPQRSWWIWTDWMRSRKSLDYHSLPLGSHCGHQADTGIRHNFCRIPAKTRTFCY